MSNTNTLIAHEGLELLTFGSPSGYKISIILEELKAMYGTTYTVQVIDFRQNVQKQPWFTKLNPNGRIPVLVDHDAGGLTIMEGQAILQYLAGTYDKDHRLSFAQDPERSFCEQWICFAQSHLGPYTSECFFFNRRTNEHNPFAIQHFVGELERLYGVLDNEYVAVFAAIDVGPAAEIDRSLFLNPERWWCGVAKRPAVQKGSAVPFSNPLVGAAYLQQVSDDPEFRRKEEELFHAVELAKQKYGYKYSCP